MDLKIELNICLLPAADLSERIVSASRQYEKSMPQTCIVTLQGDENPTKESGEESNKEIVGKRLRLQLVPHLTLYQVSLPVASLTHACGALKDISTASSVVDATATEVVYNGHEGSLEQRYATTLDLVSLQSRVIEALNPMRRSLLLERDPAGTTRTVQSRINYCTTVY